MSLRLTEIFHSLQGEAARVGLPTVFIRLTGCPLRCTWCDTTYSFTGGSAWEIADILAEVAALPQPPLCVGFAAETQNLADYADKKRRAKKIPLIAGNLIQEGFGGDNNTLILFDDNGQLPLTPAPKLQLARQLIARIAALLENPYAPH